MQGIVRGETGGNCKAVGLSGETGCTQHMPETWKENSKKALGYVARQSFINEQYVTAYTVQKWLDKGYDEYQIGLLYNGGELKEKKGQYKNKEGVIVKYDSGAYARRLVALTAYAAE